MPSELSPYIALINSIFDLHGKTIELDIVVRFAHHNPVVWKEISPRNTCLLTILHDYVFQSLF